MYRVIIYAGLLLAGCSHGAEVVQDVCDQAQPRPFLNAHHNCLHDELGDVSDLCATQCAFGGQYESHGDYVFCRLDSGEFMTQAICVPR